MPRPFDVNSLTLKEIAQQLLAIKTQARSAENICDSLHPLADTEAALQLSDMGNLARSLSFQATQLYQMIAKEAMQA